MPEGVDRVRAALLRSLMQRSWELDRELHDRFAAELRSPGRRDSWSAARRPRWRCPVLDLVHRRAWSLGFRYGKNS